MALEIATLDRLTMPQLADCFRALYGQAPPKKIREKLLTRAIAHRLQEQAVGGPDKALAKRLRQLAAALREGGEVAAPRPVIRPGTRLIREWKGETHAVTVTETGFLYQGEIHGSLSRIARRITGTRWSGPAFFGVAGGR